MLRVAVIGPGWIGRRHLELLSSEDGVELVGVVGRSIDATGEAAARFGGRPYADVEAMLDHERPDAVWVCVPPDGHGALERLLLDRGVHLFIEKPLAADLETPEVIARAVAASDLVVGVAYHWRALDTLHAVEDTLAGRPVRLVVGAWHDSLPGTAWWRVHRKSGGQLVEQATHIVDLSRRLVGEARVMAATADRHPNPAHPSMDVADVTTALLRYEGGAAGTFTATCILETPGPRELRLIADGLEIAISESGVTFEGSATGPNAAARRIPTGNDPYREENRVFLAAIRSGDKSQLLSTYADALATHRLTTAIRAAAEASPPAGELRPR